MNTMLQEFVIPVSNTTGSEIEEHLLDRDNSLREITRDARDNTWQESNNDDISDC